MEGGIYWFLEEGIFGVLSSLEVPVRVKRVDTVKASGVTETLIFAR